MTLVQEIASVFKSRKGHLFPCNRELLELIAREFATRKKLKEYTNDELSMLVLSLSQVLQPSSDFEQAWMEVQEELLE